MKFSRCKSRIVSCLKLTVYSLSLIVCCLLPQVRAQKQYSIAEIQGDKNISPHVGEDVSVSGVVTARTRTGFFLQTPDDKADGNPATSEGIFIFTKNQPPEEILVGNAVSVTGKVDEYRPRNTAASLTTNEISKRLGEDSLKVISKTNPLPQAIILTSADFAANSVDELERFEGMRVSVDEMSVVAPTGGRVDIKSATADSDGVFYAVVKGLPRPFREPGLDIREFLASAEREKWKKDLANLQLFDSNPEVIRVESVGQGYGKIDNLGGGLMALKTYGHP